VQHKVENSFRTGWKLIINPAGEKVASNDISSVVKPTLI
jgi:hypothetical protein